MNRLKICFVSHLYPVDRDDYKGVFVHKMAASLASRGHEVHVVTPRRPGTPRQEQRDGVHIHRHWMWGWRGGTRLGQLQGPALLTLGSLLISGIAALLRVVLRYRIDLIQAYWVVPGGFIALVGGWLTRRPVVATASGSDLNVVARRRLIRPFVLATLRGIDRLIANGSEMGRLAHQLGMAPDRIDEVPVVMGIDLDPPSAHDAGDELAGEVGSRLLYLGNLTPPKRVDTILRALSLVVKRMAQVRLTIVGDGDLRPQLERMVEELGLTEEVLFLGARPHREVFPLLRAADVVVHCSDSEGLPVVISEAMGAGTPVVASAVGGVSNLVKEGETGYLVAPDDAETYAERIGGLLADPALRERLGRQAHHYATTHLNQGAVIDRIETIYEKTLGRS
jgi:teichuronic acid biosynthesis glycosyltransferase TuaC